MKRAVVSRLQKFFFFIPIQCHAWETFHFLVTWAENVLGNFIHFFFFFFLCAVLDTAAGVWCDTKSVVTSPRTGRYSADAAGGDAAVELTRRCRHAAAAVGDLIFIYGGLRGGKK